MIRQVVVGLYHTAGTSEDVCNRLKYEGVPAAHVSLVRLREHDPLPASMAAQAQGYAGDPLFGGIVLKRFGERIGDGEAAVCVDAESDDEVRIAVGTMRQYEPIGVELLEPAEVESFLRAETAKVPQ
jgi:hypothetical protein